MPTSKDVERAISLGAKIEETRKYLESLESEMATLVGGTTKRVAIPIQPSQSEDTPPSTEETILAQKDVFSVPEMVLAKMHQTPGRSFSSKDFKFLTPDVTTIQNVRSALVRLAKSSQIRKVSRGKYRLSPAQVPLPNVAAAQK